MATEPVKSATNVKPAVNTNNVTKTMNCRVVEVINDKFFIAFKGLRFSFINKNNKYKKGDIVTVEYTKNKMSIKEK
ncbi:hypothetical protein ACFHWD_04090 [Clostridium sp. MT-14]|uniref:hypothetical protein n=1 Tax=Clostridium sp. MT-14 TaxID=3348360 RepID=UPI0035F30640